LRRGAATLVEPASTSLRLTAQPNAWIPANSEAISSSGSSTRQIEK
jgi:hypothetical protein